MRRWGKRLVMLLAVGGIVGLAMAALLYRNARADPVVRTVRVALPRWPADARPVRLVLWSDLHLGDAATDPARLERVARQVTELRPDLVVIAGDFVSGHDPGKAQQLAPELTRALSLVRARMGTIVVLGNHDHWSGAEAVRAAVRRAGATVLDNAAVVRGPLVIGGVDDDYTGHAQVATTIAAMRALSGAPVLVSHSPDVAPGLPDDVPLLLAGHSHCGQIVLPILGPPVLPLKTGARYLCGVVRERERTVVVAAGTGTSVLPFRLGAPPDFWVVEVGPRP